MSRNWLASELVFDLFLTFLVVVFANPERVSATIPKIFKFMATGQTFPLPSDIQIGLLFLLISILSILLLSSITPILLGLFIESRDLIDEARG